jgi:hypothetical protein
MSTDDCKALINAIADTYLLNPQDKWKRVRKYKHDNFMLRDFKSTSGDILTISESIEGILGVYSLSLVTTELSKNALQCLTKDKLFKELNALAVKMKLKEQIEINLRSEGVDCSYEFISQLIDDQLINDVNFDLENIELVYYFQDNISYLKLEAGGDWEYPILGFFYWSDPTKSIKGFFPLGEGNTYNIATNTAYGSEDENEEGYEENMQDLDCDECVRIGFQQFKEHIQRDYKDI